MEEKRSLISQESILNEKSEVWGNWKEYEEDYKIIIRQRELIRIPFLHQSPQAVYRKYIVEYLKNYAADKGISYSCLHMAVYMLDIFMDNHSIVADRLYLVANTCLLLAAKYEELKLNIPKFEELNDAVDDRYSLNDYKLVEIIILKFFHWYLMLPTPAHYTHYYMQAILSPDDLTDETTTYRTLIFELNEFIRIYLDKVVDDIHFMQLYTPSKLAAAIVSAARKQLGLHSWTEQLQNFTQYSKEQIYEPLQALLKSDYIKCSICKKSVSS